METTLPDKFSLGFQFLKEAALSAINSVTEAAEQFKESPTGISLNNWLEVHPVMLWIVSHPLISLVIAIVGIVLLLGLLKAVIKLVEKMWLDIFKAPFLTIKALFKKKSKSVEEKKPIEVESTPIEETPVDQTDNSSPLDIILERLNTIEREQKLILKEIATIKNSNNSLVK